MQDSRRCDICNIFVHRASYAKHLKSKKNLENIRQNEINIPEWLFKEKETTNEEKIKKNAYYLKTLKRITRYNIELDDKQVHNELSKEMATPCYFTDEILKIGFKIHLDSLNINHANFILSIIPINTDCGIETL